MNLDKNALKRLIEQSKPSDLLILNVNKLEKNSIQICQKEIEKFINKQEDYVIAVFEK